VNSPGRRCIGASIARDSVKRLVAGRGTFVDDVVLPRMLHAAFARSPFAHARITRIDASKAARNPGIAVVLTGKELEPHVSGWQGVLGHIPALHRFAERDVSRVPALAADLVNHKVAVIFTDTTLSALAVKAATTSIPIVFAIGADPVKSGLVTSLNRPGGDVTGVSFFTNQMEAKRLGLLHEVAPKVELVAALLNGNNPFVDNQTKDLEEASHALDLKLLIGRAGNEHEITNAFTNVRAATGWGAARGR
jgi:ABC-type uncharacterized transport system substrate-binding protein